jgi:hypothetical protein
MNRLGLDPAQVAQLPPEELPALLAGLAALQAAVAARLVALPRPEPVREPEPRDRWLTVPQAAALLGKSPRYIYRRLYAVRDPWDFVTRDGRTVLIGERGLLEHMERHRVRNGD